MTSPNIFLADDTSMSTGPASVVAMNPPPFIHDTSFIQTSEIVAITTKKPNESILNNIKFDSVVPVTQIETPGDETLQVGMMGSMSVLHEVDEGVED